MTDEDKSSVTEIVTRAVKSARAEAAPKSNLMDKMNLGVTLLAFIVAPVCWLLVSQKIDIKVSDVASSAKDTYVDKPTFNNSMDDVKSRLGRQEQHIDSIDSRENNDKSVEDLKIQALQDSVGKKFSANATTNTYFDHE